jgi:hypothetical protein
MPTEQAPSLNTSLSSLALLSLQMEEGHDYLDYLRGFVIEALHQIKTPSFDAGEVQTVVHREFGLRIPVATFAIYLKRLQAAKVVDRTPDGRQFRTLNLPPSSISGDRKEAIGRIAEVTQKLRAYALARYGQEWSDNQTAAALTDFVREYSIEFVRFTEFRSPLPDPGPESRGVQFIVASFIGSCADGSTGVFDSIQILVQSHILANALLSPEIKKTGLGFQKIIFVLDTRLLLKAFDLEAPIDTQNTLALLDNVRRLKGSLCIFPETKDEIQTVLRGIIKGFQQGGARGPVVEELRKRGRGVADVILAANKLEEYLKRLNVSTLQSPSYDEHTYKFQLDEEGLRAELGEELGYALGRAADHDVHAVRSIFALRRNRKVTRLEDCGYVFVSTNGALSRAAFHQGRKEGEGWIFSAVITDFHLSHLVWLISPSDSGDLARAEILSSCYAAMRPAQSVWKKYLAEVDRLKAEGQFTERDYEVLRLSLNAPEELMEVTQGEVEGITEANLRTILSRLEQTYAAEKDKQIEQLRIDRENIEGELASVNVAAKEKEDSLSMAAQREALHQAEIERLKASEKELADKKKRHREKIDKLSNRIATVTYVICWVVFAIAVLFSLLSNWNLLFAIPAATLGLFNIAAGLSGKSIRSFVRQKVESSLSAFVE